MVEVYYPYFQKASRWEELRYSLRSVGLNLKEEFSVCIVGDLPEWCQNVTHIPHQRCEDMMENQTFDAISKLQLFCQHLPQQQGFMRMYDDIYLLQPVILKEIQVFKALYDWPGVDRQCYLTWNLQLIRSLEAVMAKGFHGWMTETHLPEYFEKDKMLFVIEDYHALENRLLTSTLYHNTYFPSEDPFMVSDDYATLFYDNRDEKNHKSSEGDLFLKCRNRLFMNHNDAGLNQNLKDFIQKSFPEKSRFEK